MKNIENKRTWKIREKMVRLFKAIGSLGTKEVNRTHHLCRDDKPPHFHPYEYVNSPQTLAIMR